MGLITNFRYKKISQSATVNDVLKEFFRKSIHLCASLVPAIAIFNFSFTITSLSIIVCIYFFCEYKRLSGNAIPVISRITVYASRKRDEGKFVLGPVTMAMGIIFTLLLFPIQAATVGIYALAFGDGVASLAGKLYGRTKIPFVQGKTLEGSSACFVAVYLSSMIILKNPLHCFLIALCAVLIELIPIKDYDNLLIPLCIAGVACLLP